MKKLISIYFILFLFLHTIYSQFTSQDTLLAKQYLKQKGISEIERKSLEQSKIKREILAEPVKEDTTAKKMQEKKDTISSSMYENILKDKNIEPDSLLKTLTVFGLDVFLGTKPTTFAPSDYAATPADYVVGSGDEVIVLLWGRINEEYRLKIDRDGRINIPRIGPVPVAGLPFSALQKNIIDRVQNIEGVQATVSMGELRSIGVYIVGEVKSPGYYTISGLSNITNALFAAGGPTKQGSLRNIYLKRNGNTIATIDFYDFLLSGKDNTNIRLKSGDVIIVPIVKQMVAIAGNVRRSALYEIKPHTKLKDAIELAGGLSPAAWTNRIQVQRFIDNKMQIVLDLTSETSKSLPDFEVKDGDIIKIFPVVEKDKNAVYLFGNVLRPGKYEYKAGMKISDLIPDYNALLPETYFEYAIVLREEPPSFSSRLIPFSLKDVLEDRSSQQNIFLKPRDQVIIYARDYFEPDRIVGIYGRVNSPGIQKLLQNMTIRDLIIKAGGVTEDADLNKGELYRRIVKGESSYIDKIDFCVSCALAGDANHNLELQKYDKVYIRNIKGWKEEKKIVLKGEFVYPGEYIILEKETLENLIKRCGGFTQEAYLLGAIYTRVSVKKLEEQKKEEYINMLETDAMKTITELSVKENQIDNAQQLLNQQTTLLERLRNQKQTGRIVIDLTKPSSYKDFYLEDGDTLYVPKISGSVSVLGEVFNPATFRYESNFKVRDYIEFAGGVKQNADKKNIYIIRSTGNVFTKKHGNILDANLYNGDVIVVPTKIEYVNNFKIFMDTLEAIFKVVSIFSIIATLMLASKR